MNDFVNYKDGFNLFETIFSTNANSEILNYVIQYVVEKTGLSKVYLYFELILPT